MSRLTPTHTLGSQRGQYRRGKLKFLQWPRLPAGQGYPSFPLQRHINIRIAKSYRTVLNEALCILTGLTLTGIKTEETIQFYEYIRGSTKEEALADSDMGVKYWHHPAEMITFLTEDNEGTSTIQIFTDGSKSEQGVGTGIVIFKSGNLINP